MTLVRFTVTGAGPWQVVVTRAEASTAPRDDDRVLARYEMAATGSPRAFPAIEDGLDAAAIARTIEALRTGGRRGARASAAEVEALGRHLFAALCAPAWPGIVDAYDAAPAAERALRLLELALDLDGAPDLRALPWELLAWPPALRPRTGEAWLSAGATLGGVDVAIAITRRTHRGAAATPPLAHPLRYLFVVGVGLGDPVRAGAECFGLLRQIGAGVQERIVQRQSLEQLAAIVRDFEPHVVHVICHGREDEDGAIELELWSADHNQPEYVSGAAFAHALVRDDARRGGTDPAAARTRAPAIVILSACASGDRMVAAGDGALARTLVAAGVPIVVGMAAEIRDQACRLFTRGLGAALVDRVPVVRAAVRGRRAALRAHAPTDAFDWGQVQLLLGHDVEPDRAVAPADADPDDRLVMQWLGAAALPIDLPDGGRHWPPLCGGVELTDALFRLLAGPHAALVVVARPPRADVKVGRRRAMAELAAAAIRAGHVPVLVLPVRHTQAGLPDGRAAVVEHLARAVDAAWDRHDLDAPLPAPSSVTSLGESSARPSALATLAREAAAREAAAGTVPAPAGRAVPSVRAAQLLAALAADCGALRARARAMHPLIARASGQVVLFLHDAHDYGDGTALVLELLHERGAAKRTIAPIVASWRMTPRGPLDGAIRARDDELHHVTQHGKAWIRALDLAPLAPITLDAVEAVPLPAKLALQRVLLHPHRTSPAFAAQRYLLDLDAPDLDDVLETLVTATGGCCPGEFADDRFFYGLRAVKARLRIADDDAVLAAGGEFP